MLDRFNSRRNYKDQSTKTKDLRFSGGCVERATPVPIPNTEVKPLGADGTARATAWESRKPPGLLNTSPPNKMLGGLLISQAAIRNAQIFGLFVPHPRTASVRSITS